MFKKYFFEYGDLYQHFVCHAEDREHAREQCRVAHPDEYIHDA